MSTLIVNVCKIEDIKDHPNADRLKIAIVKGWQTCIASDSGFKVGEKVIFFPPDAILPPELANAPDDEIPGRLNVMRYLKKLPKNKQGGRVAATRLRGEQSFGFIAKIDPEYGDDPNWKVGTDLKEYFGIKKYEPPTNKMGDSEKENTKFYRYTNIEHWANFPDVLQPGEEVVITEKIHGTSSRMGYVLETEEKEGSSYSYWKKNAGSHNVNRKQFMKNTKRFEIHNLPTKDDLSVDKIIHLPSGYWRIDRLNEKHIYCTQMTTENGGFVELLDKSLYWSFFDENVDSLLKELLGKNQNAHSIIIYGEIYGPGVQDLHYGLTNEKSYRAFDISIDNKYLNYSDFASLCDRHGVDRVPVLYVGEYNKDIVNYFVSGKTTLDGNNIREGVVVKPTKERYDLSLNSNAGRVIFKSISADYLGRKGGTEYH